MLAAVLGGLGELYGWLIPTISWPFTAARQMRLLSCPEEFCPALAADGRVQWFGWLVMLLMFAGGLFLFRLGKFHWPPQTRQALVRFRGSKTGVISLGVLMALLALAGADQALVGKRALVVVTTQGDWYFPAFRRHILPGSVFGLSGNAGLAEADYRLLHASLGKPGGPQFVLMPPIPYDPAGDTSPFPIEPLPAKSGRLFAADAVTPYDGLACRLYPDGNVHLRIRYRKGVPDGVARGWAPDRREVYSATWEHGNLIRESYRGNGSISHFLQQSSVRHFLIHYHPAPPLSGNHLLGTDSRGQDIAAILFGGLQVNVKAALFYLPMVYGIGLFIGMLMGYWGGIFDIVAQRIIEILSQLPFLFIVMAVTDMVPQSVRGLPTTLLLMGLLGWMPVTYLIRTGAMREKTRDYVSAARAMGASTLHIMLRHILPNLSGIIVTLIPFSFVFVVLSLSSLDYLGFGLPDTCASWGRLLNDGLARLSCPWIASSAVGALVIMLLLITFIGEAARESTAPRRLDHYE